jgi:hypothetical protein
LRQDTFDRRADEFFSIKRCGNNRNFHAEGEIISWLGSHLNIQHSNWLEASR